MSMGAQPDTVPGRLIARALGDPSGVALEVVGVGQLTYAEWERRSAGVATALRDLGVRRGDAVVVTCDGETTLEYAVAYVGVQRAGCVPVPALTGLGWGHLRVALSRTGAVGVIGQVDVANVWCHSAASLAAREAGDASGVSLDPGDPAEILWTSGSTGRPKAVVATHENVLFTHAGGGSPRRVYHAIAPGTQAGQSLMLLALHPSGRRVIVMGQFEARDFLRGVAERQPDHVVISPYQALAVLGEAWQAYDLSSVSTVRVVSDAATPATLAGLDRAFGRAKVVVVYTSAEAWPAMTSVVVDSTRPLAVGRPENRSGVRVVDDAGREVPPGVQGYVLLRAAGAPQRSYYADSGASQEVFLRDGWVRTGDVGRVDLDGYLYLAGRATEVVMSGGLGISPAEVEGAALEFEGVSGACAFGVQHGKIGQALILAVTGDVDVDAVGDFVDARVGELRRPKDVIRVDSIPLTTGGKPDRDRLRAQYEVGRQADGAGAGDGALVEEIRALWASVLQVAVPDDRTFLELGGGSFDAMKILGALLDRFRVDVRPRSLYRSTVGGFTDVVAGAPRAPERLRAIPRVGGSGEVPASYIQRDWWYSVDGGASNDNVLVTVDVVGPLDAGALRAALGRLVVRHETLRTCLVAGEHGVRQKIASDCEVPLDEVSVRSRGEVYGALEGPLHEPFELSSCPLWRGRLVRLGPDRHVLAIVLQHVIGDRWSGAVILRDVARLYEDVLQGREGSDELPVQFADFAAWEQDQRGDEALERRWRERLTPLPPYPRLAAGDWSPGRPFTLAAQPFPRISREDTRALRGVAEAQGLTLGAALHGVIAATMSPYVVGDRVMVGVLHAMPRRAGLVDAIGPLVDNLPMPVQVGGRATLLDVLESVRSTWDAMFRDRLPLGQIDAAVRGAPVGGRALFDVVGNYFPYTRAQTIEIATNGGPVRFAFYPETNSDAQRIAVGREFSFAVRMGHTILGTPAGGLAGSVFVNAEAVGWERLRPLCAAFSRGLVAVTRHPERPVRELIEEVR